MTRITLARIGKNATVQYAVDELFDYLKKMDPQLYVDIRVYKEYDPFVKKVIWVGESPTFDAFLPEVTNKKLDDSIFIDIQNNEGIITGSNPRAVLIAAYRVLKHLGVRWIRATDDGELVPSRTIESITLHIKEKASHRHRTVCIEGTVSYEHVLNMIKWIPRAGMSGYMFQFFRPFHFFHHWYEHTYNKYYSGENVSREDVDRITDALKEEIEKRDLLFYNIGHGWTAKPLGLPYDGWIETPDAEVPEDSAQYLAMINGERKLFGSIPINTNLCYSNPEVRELLSNAVLEYCLEEPNVYCVLFELADGKNNNCECENCKERPADYLVMILNDIDKKLTENGIDTKIAFPIYHDLLWGPIKEKFHNPSRFIYEFAPITRTYTHSYDEIDTGKNRSIPPYIKNKTTSPRDIETNIAFFEEWKHAGYDDSFVFDYHIMWDHLMDLGYHSSAQMIHRDMRAIKKLGFGGMVSCQLTRCAFPSNLPLQIMADTLWNIDCDFDEMADSYYLSAFGEDWIAFKEYAKKLAYYLDPVYSRGETPYCQDERGARALTAKIIATEFESIVHRNIGKNLPHAQHKSWEYLTYHIKYVRYFAECILAAVCEGDEAREKMTDAFADYLLLNEQKLHKVLDVNVAIDNLNDCARAK